MAREMPSIKREIDKLDDADRERRIQEGSARFMGAFLKAYDNLPPKDQETILDLMKPKAKTEE